MQFLTSVLCSNPTCISLLLFTAAQGENVIPPGHLPPKGYSEMCGQWLIVALSFLVAVYVR